MAFASTAPVAPATALPQGGRGLASIAVCVLSLEDVGDGGERRSGGAELNSHDRASRRVSDSLFLIQRRICLESSNRSRGCGSIRRCFKHMEKRSELSLDLESSGPVAAGGTESCPG
jgi:hypothetical protein